MLVNNIQAYLPYRNYQQNKKGLQFTGARELVYAAGRGNLDEVKKEVESGTNVRSMVDGTDALMQAAYNNQDKVVDYLLEQPDINVNAISGSGRTALHMSLVNQDVFTTDDIVGKLVERDDIDVRIKDFFGKTAWDYYQSHRMLARNPRTEQLLYIKTFNPEAVPAKFSSRVDLPDINIEVDINKLSPENNIWTSEAITECFLNLLRESKYSLARQMLNSTPLISMNDSTLQSVMSTGNVELAKEVFDYKLIKQGDMLKDYHQKRETFFDGMKRMSFDELIKSQIVLNTPDGFVNLLARKEFDPNIIIDGSSLFEKVCVIDSTGVLVRQILSKYDDVFTNNVKTKHTVVKNMVKEYNDGGRYVTKLNNIERNIYDKDKGRMAMQQLKDYVNSEEFSPKITDAVGNTAVHIATGTSYECAKEIIYNAMRKGFDVNTKNSAGQTPLMLSLKTLRRTTDKEERRNILSIIRFLLDKGADVNIQDVHGQSSLHYVCATDSPTALKMILDKNPNIALPDKKGQRAKKYLEGKPEMLQIYDNFKDR